MATVSGGGEMRALMPEVAAFVDALQAAFGSSAGSKLTGRSRLACATARFTPARTATWLALSQVPMGWFL